MAVPKLRFLGFEEEWSEKKIGELAEIVRGASPRPIQDPKWFDNESEIGWLRISDVTKQNGRIHYLEQKISKLGQEKTRVLIEPHLLLSIAATVGKPVINYIKTGVHDGFLIFLNPLFNQEFMFQWLEMFRPNWQKFGQPGSQVNLNSELVRNQEIFIPNKAEQEKIASFFETIDKKIQLQQEKVELFKKQKKGLMQKIFSQELRFKDENGQEYPKWEKIKLGDFTIKTGKKNNKGISYPTGSISNKHGFILQNEDSNYDISAYKIVNKGEFAYNPSRINVGSYGVQSTVDKAIVSSLYVIFKTSPQLHAHYLKHFMDTLIFRNEVLKNVEGSVREYLFYENFSNIRAPLPCVEEQEKIASFFAALANKIIYEEDKLEKNKMLKKYFMQQMYI